MDHAWTQASDDGSDERVEQATARLHARDAMERTQELFEHAARRSPSARIELYRRVARRTRITSSLPSRTADVESGIEEGIAVRAIAADGRRGFAACSGGSSSAVAWALDAAERHQSLPRVPEVDWVEGGRHRDVDPSSELPTVDRLVAWLASHPACGWIEGAETVETWAATGGFAALRTRSRAWCSIDSTILASRSLDDLGGSIDAEAPKGENSAEVRRNQSVTVVLLPEPSAQLVAAISRVLHHDPAAGGWKVGEGWNLNDDPTIPGAVLGGTFDDAGFPTRRTQLADGRTVVGTIGAAGFLRRGSYRDRPVPVATNLVVTPRTVSAPRGALWAARVQIHPLDAQEWVLEVGGAAEPFFLRAQPGGLAERCVGGVGAARSTSRGVVTPALVFEGLSTTQ